MLRCCMLVLFVLVSSVSAQKASWLPPMGWTTWCTEDTFIPCVSDYCDEKEIRSVADSMVSNKLVDLGYNYVLLDDCWAATSRDANNSIQPDPTRFPSGMKSLADYLHKRGMKLGLYTDVGNKTCKNGRTGSWDRYEQDALTFASWGIDYVKMDWCGHPADAKTLYTRMSLALNATGRPIMFGLCEWGLYDVWTWAGPIANLWRVGPDHLPLWWTPALNQDPGQGQGTANIIQHMAGLSKYVQPGAFNDPDFLMPGYWWNGAMDDETEFSFWCLFAAPLMVATDVRDLSNKQVILNTEAIAVSQDALVKAGDLRVNNSDGSQIWSRPLVNSTWAVIMYNSNIVFGDVSLTLQFNNAVLPGWPANTNKASVRDINAHKDLGTFTGSFKSNKLVPHQVQFVIVKPVAGDVQ